MSLLEMIYDIVFEFILEAWTGYMKRKGKQHVPHKKSTTVIINIIILLMVILGILLIIAMLAAITLLIERLFDVRLF